MLFWWICGGESVLPVLLLHRLGSSYMEHLSRKLCSSRLSHAEVRQRSKNDKSLRQGNRKKLYGKHRITRQFPILINNHGPKGINVDRYPLVQFSCSVVSYSLQPHESQHARPPCPSPTPGVHLNSCALSQWCHPDISSSVVPFYICPPLNPSQHQSLFQWVNSSHEVAKVLEFQL